MSAYGLSKTLTAAELVPSRSKLPTTNLLLLLLFTSTMSSLTPTRDAEWPKTLTSTFIEQLQFTGDESVGSSSNKIKLNFNHPVKELIWVVQPDENVDYCASLECGQTLYRVLGAQPFNYTDAIDRSSLTPIHSFGGPESVAATTGAFIDADGLFQDAGAVDVTSLDWWQNTPDYSQPNLGFPGIQNSGVSDSGTFVLAETALDMHCWGENPVVTAKLQLNGQD